MLVKALERTGGQEEQGVKGLKDALKKGVLERMAEFEQNRFYLISTIVDPR